MCFAPQRRALFRHLNFQKWSENGVFCTVNRHFPTFSRICTFFLLIFSLLALLTSAFQLSILSEVSLLNFLRQLRYTTFHYPSLHIFTLHYTPLHCNYNYNYTYTTTLHYTKLHCTTLPYTTLHSTTLQLKLHYYTPLHSTTLNYTTLHYIALH